MRTAFRCQRRARIHRQLQRFYVEHNLFELAKAERALMMEQLRGARALWRLAIRTKMSIKRPRAVEQRHALDQHAMTNARLKYARGVSLRTLHDMRSSSADIPAVSTMRKVSSAFIARDVTDVLGVSTMNPPSA